MSDIEKAEILKELQRITKLLVLTATKGQTQREQIAVLSKLGYQPKEVAEILGTTPGTVSVALVDIRKKAKGGRGKIVRRPEESESDDEQTTS